MYGPNQIIYDKDRKVPVRIGDIWDPEQYPKRHTHFIKAVGFNYDVATPRSIEEAVDLLERGIIVPAPAPVDSHCWKCGNWYNNCASFKECTEWSVSAEKVAAVSMAMRLRKLGFSKQD